jgi:hypothetical protein
LTQCSETTRAGAPCKGVAIDALGLCVAHHPEFADARRRNASKGGKRGGRGRPVAELAALRVENADIRERLLEGKLRPGVAAVAIQSINTDIRAVSAALKAREQEEFEARLEQLEQVMEQKESDRWRA